MTVCSCHVTYAFQGESTLYSCLNVKELLARSRREIWKICDECDGNLGKFVMNVFKGQTRMKHNFSIPLWNRKLVLPHGKSVFLHWESYLMGSYGESVLHHGSVLPNGEKVPLQPWLATPLVMVSQ